MSQKIFISSGGTGGHIIPARCLAQQLAADGVEVLFLGDEKYRGYIKASDQFKSKIISSSQIKKSPIFLVKAALKIALGILQSLHLFLTQKPKCIFAFGGYSTFPLLIAAIVTKTDIILHEQNAHLGKVNRIFAKYAKKIALSFHETSGISAADLHKTIFVGNPVRDEILDLHKLAYSLPVQEVAELRKDNKMGYDLLLASDFYQEEKAKNLFKILVIGGSGGAKIFSEILPKAFFNLSENFKEQIQVTQQCRKELMRETFDTYRSFNVNIVIDSFFENMPELIKESHLVIARSGSSSIFEFCAAKKPMILVPFALAADNHQEKNAKYLEKNGAAIVVSEAEFTINKVNELLKNLIESGATLKKMSENAGELAVCDATKNLANLAK
ncbi:MAG: undecaprenyldiphospho-muramoylpentapeptide beta-N-acetylglucosaminyltransferase [Rickettsiales bacterium]|nr:undecaprenyldiphospho-muramoylpentapeptide beta-N-acetylglucosaminyltransferase [Rickettsiales bacterium]